MNLNSDNMAKSQFRMKQKNRKRKPRQVWNLAFWADFVQYIHTPVDSSSLAVSRILFGLLMVLDIPEERGLSKADIRYGSSLTCHFPLINDLQPLPLEWMCMVYLVMWLGAFGMMLGAFYRLSCFAFVLPYWYIFLLDKHTWNNHSYLYGLVSFLFLISNAHHSFSVDALQKRIEGGSPVPLWNYGILRFQFYVLYFYAGVKKLNADWLQGYSVTLADHWTFSLFTAILPHETVNYWIVHLNGFFLDLTASFWLYFDSTRPIVMFFLAIFHFMNSQIFSIAPNDIKRLISAVHVSKSSLKQNSKDTETFFGFSNPERMFPYVCLATMPLYCCYDWPKRTFQFLRSSLREENYGTSNETKDSKTSVRANEKREKLMATSTGATTKKQQLTTVLLIFYALLQLFLPFSHFITRGYNNWTNGLYGYSWDMMVHSWDTTFVSIKILNNDTGEARYLDSKAWVESDRWTRHGDMHKQYAKCVEKNLKRNPNSPKNISIYVDVRCSLNKRFQQRMFDPNIDLLSVYWSPFKPVSWLKPLLTELNSRREKLFQLEKEIHSWSNYSDVSFIADFPGLHFENIFPNNYDNVTLWVLAGRVIYEEDRKNTSLSDGEKINVATGTFHKIYTISSLPSSYMYTYYNKAGRKILDGKEKLKRKRTRCQDFADAILHRWQGITKSLLLLANSLVKISQKVATAKKMGIQLFI